MDKDNVVRSPFVEYVLEKTKNYEIFNAESCSGADVAFAKKVAELLPSISEMKRYLTPVPSDTFEIYSLESSSHQFIVKRAIPSRMTQMPEDYFLSLQTQFTRAERYLGGYMPVTTIIKKSDELTKREEVFVAQDIVEGQSLKELVFYGKTLEKEITKNMRTQIVDIIDRIKRMYTETGQRVEVDFVFDFDNDRVVFYDFDRQSSYNSDYYSERIYDYLEKHFDIRQIRGN